MNKSDRERSPGLLSRTLRFLLDTAGFTIVACLVVVAGTFVLFAVVEHGGQFVTSERLRSILALALFGLVVAIPAYLFARRTSR